MKAFEALAIAACPENNKDKLILAHLKIGNLILGCMPCSRYQQQLIDARKNIEKMPKRLWHYDP